MGHVTRFLFLPRQIGILLQINSRVQEIFLRNVPKISYAWTVALLLILVKKR